MGFDTSNVWVCQRCCGILNAFALALAFFFSAWVMGGVGNGAMTGVDVDAADSLGSSSPVSDESSSDSGMLSDEMGALCSTCGSNAVESWPRCCLDSSSSQSCVLANSFMWHSCS